MHQDAYTPELQTTSHRTLNTSDSKSRQSAPTTPNLSNALFAKRVKSPRRMLLAKRALLVQDKDDILSQRKSAGQRYQSSACQCFGKPQVCSMCSSRLV